MKNYKAIAWFLGLFAAAIGLATLPWEKSDTIVLALLTTLSTFALLMGVFFVVRALLMGVFFIVQRTWKVLLVLGGIFAGVGLFVVTVSALDGWHFVGICLIFAAIGLLIQSVISSGVEQGIRNSRD